jgi:hypothetical protein
VRCQLTSQSPIVCKVLLGAGTHWVYSVPFLDCLPNCRGAVAVSSSAISEDFACNCISMFPICAVLPNAFRFSAGRFDHLRHGCSGCCLRDVACADLGRPKKKGRRDVRVYGALNRLAGCGGEPVVRSYHRQGKSIGLLVGTLVAKRPRTRTWWERRTDPHRARVRVLVLVRTLRRPNRKAITIRGKQDQIFRPIFRNRSGLCFRSHTRGKRRPQKIRDACRQASLQIGTLLTAAPQELRTTGRLKQWRPNYKSMTLRRKRVSDLVAMLVEGGRKVGSGLL